jgi:PAS domain-containing protein
MSGEIQDYELEQRYVRRDGQVIWVHLAVALVRDANQEPVRCIASVLDVTERRRAEAALRESEGRLRLAKTAARLGIYDVDISSGLIQWDDRARELWGIEPGSSHVRYTRGRPRFTRRIAKPSSALSNDRSRRPVWYFAQEYRVVSGPEVRTRWVASPDGCIRGQEGRAVGLGLSRTSLSESNLR